MDKIESSYRFSGMPAVSAVIFGSSLAPIQRNFLVLVALLLIGSLLSLIVVLLYRQRRLSSENKRLLSQLEDLSQFSVQIGHTLETNAALDQLCITASKLSGSLSSAVFLHYLGEGQIQLESGYQLSEHFMASNRSFLFSPGGRAQSLSTGRPVLVPNLVVSDQGHLTTDSSFLFDLRREGIQAYGDFPLVSQDGLIGYLSVYYDRPHPFPPEEVQLMEMIAAQAAISVLNARLHGRTDATLSRRIHQLSILESVGRQMAESIQSDRLFEMILNYAVEFTDANWGSIGLINAQAKRVMIKASRGYTGLPMFLSSTDGLAGRAIQLEQIVNSSDVRGEKVFVDYTSGEARSHLSVPILHASRMLGVITLESARANAFSSTDEIFISQLAVQAAVAIELYQSVQTRELITETLVHDIRSPVTAVLGALDVIEDSERGIEEDGSDEASHKIILRAVGVARQGAHRVLVLIESLMDIARFQSGKLEIFPECVNLQPLVNEVFQPFEAQSSEYGVTLSNQVPHDLPELYVDLGKITRVISNLIDNALKFSPSGSQLIVRASEKGNQEVQIQVIDSGPGIPAEYRDQVFERFTQVPGVQGRRRGTGLGLTFCRLAVEAHGGQIWVEVNPAGGSIFNLTLPSKRPPNDPRELSLL